MLGHSGLRLWATQSFPSMVHSNREARGFSSSPRTSKTALHSLRSIRRVCMPSTPFIERRQSCNGKAAVRTKYSTINADLGLDMDQLHHHLQDEHIKTTRYAPKSDETQIFPCFLIKSFGLERPWNGVNGYNGISLCDRNRWRRHTFDQL